MTKFKKNMGILIVIIGVLYLGNVIYKAPITFDSLSNQEELSQLNLSIERTAYSDELGFELNETNSYEIISVIASAKYFRNKNPDYYHGDEQFHFR